MIFPLKNLLLISIFFIKFYKTLCYTKMILNWLPKLNPYLWPVFYFKVLTNFYFSFWAQMLKFINISRFAFRLSDLIALEFLDLIISFLTFILYRLTKH